MKKTQDVVELPRSVNSFDCDQYNMDQVMSPLIPITSPILEPDDPFVSPGPGNSSHASVHTGINTPDQLATLSNQDDVNTTYKQEVSQTITDRGGVSSESGDSESDEDTVNGRDDCAVSESADAGNTSTALCSNSSIDQTAIMVQLQELLSSFKQTNDKLAQIEDNFMPDDT